jgi:hypothetical protein
MKAHQRRDDGLRRSADTFDARPAREAANDRQRTASMTIIPSAWPGRVTPIAHYVPDRTHLVSCVTGMAPDPFRAYFPGRALHALNLMGAGRY